MTMRRKIPDITVPTLRRITDAEGVFTDRDFILVNGLGRGTLQRVIDRGWADDVGPADARSRRYRLTEEGRRAVYPATPHARAEGVEDAERF